MSKTPLRIALYARVSRSDLNLDNQLLVLTDYASRQGWEAIVFTEKESTRNTRPVKEEVKQKLLARELDGVCVASLDRWARSVAEFALELNDFSERGVLFLSLREHLDITTAMGRAMAQVCSAFAELDRELIRERTLAGLARAKAQGKKLGRPRKTPPVNPSPALVEAVATEKTPDFEVEKRDVLSKEEML